MNERQSVIVKNSDRHHNFRDIAMFFFKIMCDLIQLKIETMIQTQFEILTLTFTRENTKGVYPCRDVGNVITGHK